MENLTKLSELKVGERAVISSFLPGDNSLIRLREMGLIPGSQVQLVRKAPMGDPIEIAIRGSLLSIRSHEAERIEVQIKKN